MTRLLDLNPGTVWRLFVYERPPQDPARYAGQRGMAVWSTHPERYTSWMKLGAWLWTNGQITLTPHHTYPVPPGPAQLALVFIERLHALEIAETVHWDATNGFVPPVGDLGMAVPRWEFVLWYADEQLRRVYIGQTLGDGCLYAMVFTTWSIHPIGLFRLTAGL
jgi:hypothetical protein